MTPFAASLARSYDPIGPIRSPLSRRSTVECTENMADVIVLFVHASTDGTVTKDDLHRAGFNNGEIERCYPDAAVIAAERLRPREVEDVPAKKRAA